MKFRNRPSAVFHIVCCLVIIQHYQIVFKILSLSSYSGVAVKWLGDGLTMNVSRFESYVGGISMTKFNDRYLN